MHPSLPAKPPPGALLIPSTAGHASGLSQSLSGRVPKCPPPIPGQYHDCSHAEWLKDQHWVPLVAEPKSSGNSSAGRRRRRHDADGTRGADARTDVDEDLNDHEQAQVERVLREKGVALSSEFKDTSESTLELMDRPYTTPDQALVDRLLRRGTQRQGSHDPPSSSDTATDCHSLNDSPPSSKKRRLDQSEHSADDASSATATKIVVLPYDIMAMICEYLTPPSLVSLSLSCRSFHRYFQDSLQDHVWRTSYRLYLDSSNTELKLPEIPDLNNAPVSQDQFARWMFGGGVCVYCHDYTWLEPASFSLNIRVCLNEQCRTQWNRDCGWRQDRASENFRAAVRELHKYGAPSNDTVLGSFDPWLLRNHHVGTLWWTNPALADAIRARPIRAQVPFLHHIVSRWSYHIEEPLLPERPSPAAESSLRSRMSELREIGALMKPATKNIPILGDLGSVQWPWEELRSLVKEGMTFSECGPQVPSPTGKWSLAVHVDRRYKLSDLNKAVEEWTTAASDGTTDQLVKAWKIKAEKLAARMDWARKLRKWCTVRKQAFDQIRHDNADFLRREFEAITKDMNEANPAVSITFEDLATSPTWIDVRRVSELGYCSVGAVGDWKYYKTTIVREAMGMRSRRLRRETEGMIRERRATTNALYQFCLQKYVSWGFRLLPPFPFFNTLPTIQELPSRYSETPKWDTWIPHLRIELRLWEEVVLTHLKVTAEGGAGSPPKMNTIDSLERATSLYRCVCCDAAAQVQALARHERTRESRHPDDPIPSYSKPMSYREIVTHQCEGRYELRNIRLDKPASSLARRACQAVKKRPESTTPAELMALGKAWRCGQCTLSLSWGELYTHILRHFLKDALLGGQRIETLWAKGIHGELYGPSKEKFGHKIEAVPHYFPPYSIGSLNVRPAPVRVPVAGQPIPKDFCRDMMKGSKDARDKARLKCTHCYATEQKRQAQAPKKSVKREPRPLKIMGFDGLRDHLRQKHKINTIHSEDIIIADEEGGTGTQINS